MFPSRCRGLFNASAASRFTPRFLKREKKQKHPRLPAVVPFLLLICLLAYPFFQQPVVVFAQDRAAITRVREYIPSTGILPEFEVYYPQISFGGNPNQLQTANAMMREYALQRSLLHRQAANSGALDNIPSGPVVIDYQIMRNSGGFFSVVFDEADSPSLSLANLPPHGFTVRLSDQKVCQLADLFLSNTNYTSLLDQEISRMLQRPFEAVSFHSPFFLTDDCIVLLPEEGMNEDVWPGLEPVEVSLSAPAVVRKLAIGLSVGHTRIDAPDHFDKDGKEKPQVSSEDAQMDVQEEESGGID